MPIHRCEAGVSVDWIMDRVPADRDADFGLPGERAAALAAHAMFRRLAAAGRLEIIDVVEHPHKGEMTPVIITVCRPRRAP